MAARTRAVSLSSAAVRPNRACATPITPSHNALVQLPSPALAGKNCGSSAGTKIIATPSRKNTRELFVVMPHVTAPFPPRFQQGKFSQEMLRLYGTIQKFPAGKYADGA